MKDAVGAGPALILGAITGRVVLAEEEGVAFGRIGVAAVVDGLDSFFLRLPPAALTAENTVAVETG